MKIAIVYDSVFGNTERVSKAIGEALGPADDVHTFKAVEVKPEDLNGIELLIAGSPTRGFKATPSLNNWLKKIPRNGLKGVKVAAFDTRFTQEEIDTSVFILRHLVRVFGYAAEPIATRLQKKGGILISPPQFFYVNGIKGPLLDGELERAAQWAKTLVN